MITREIKVWIGAAKGIIPPVKLSQYDTEWQFVFTVYKDDVVWDMADVSTVSLNGVKEDGTAFVYPGSISSGHVVVDCGEQMTSAAGRVECELRFFTNYGKLVSTANFRLLVEQAPMTGYRASKSEFDEMNQLVNAALEGIPAWVAEHLTDEAAAQSALEAVASAAAADASATAAAGMAENLNQIQMMAVKRPGLSTDWNFVSGGINSSGGSFVSNKYCRLATSVGTIFPLVYKRTVLTLGLSGFEWMAWTYSSNTWASARRSLTGGVYVSGNTPILVEPDDADVNFSVCVRKQNQSALTSDDIADVTAAFRMRRPVSGRADKILFLGDSLTRGRIGGQQANSRWPVPVQIAEQLGIVCENFGIGNIGWCNGYTSDNGKTNALGYLQRVGNSSYYSFADSWSGYKFIGRGDWSEFNTVMFHLGVNDTNIPLGSISDIDETLSYANVMEWKTSTEYSDKTNQTIVKAMYQAVRWIRESEANHAEGEPYVPNGKDMNIIICDPMTGIRTSRRADLSELFAEFCDRYGCVHISCYDAPLDRLHLSDDLPDNVHPNQGTYDRIARYLAGKLSGLSGVPSSASRLHALKTQEGVDFLRNIGIFSTETSNGITFTWDWPGCVISGTRTSAQAIYKVYDVRTALPAGMRPGDRFLLRYSDSYQGSNLKWFVFFWNAEGNAWNFTSHAWSSGAVAHKEDYLNHPFTIPEGCVGMTVQLRVPAGSTSFSATVYHLEFIKMRKLGMPDKMIVSFVDDDTSGYEFVRKYREACRHNGVFGNYAVLTKFSEDSYTGSGWTGPDMRQRLLSYEDEGFGMLIHLWRQSSNDPWQSMGSDEEKVAQCRSVLLKGLREMREFGFCNYNYWVTPYGVRGSRVRRIAREAGVECLISTNNGRHNSMQDYEKDFIKRVALRHDDTRPDGIANAMQDVKDAIDALVADGAGWLIITTHFNDWGDVTWDSTLDENGFEIGYSRFNEMVQYALAAGLTPMTLPRAWSYYKPILETNNDIISNIIAQEREA